MIKRSLGCFAILLLAGCAITPVPRPLQPLPLPQQFTVAGRSDKAACIDAWIGGSVESDDLRVPASSFQTISVSPAQVLRFDRVDQRIFAETLQANLQRLQLFREVVMSTSLHAADEHSVWISDGLHRMISATADADCTGAGTQAQVLLGPNEPHAEQPILIPDVIVQLIFKRTRYQPSVNGYLLEAELWIDGGREPLHRSYRIDSTQGLGHWKQFITEVEEGKQRAAAMLMERVLTDIDRWVVAATDDVSVREDIP